MKTKIELLRRVSFFSTLKEEELAIIARYSRYQDFSQGQVIFSEGSHGEELYIVKKGEVLISRCTGDQVRDLARFVTGESFGELDLLSRGPRGVQATAQQDSTLLIFPRRGLQFGEILREHPRMFALILHKLLAMVASRIRSTNKLISEKTPWVEDLRKQLLYDKLTGLYNRTFLEEDLSTRLPEYGQSTSLIMIKPDNFKEINDNFGHAAGDQVLKRLADTVRKRLRQQDIVIRFRGDEFAAVLPDTGREGAFKLAQELKVAVKGLKLKPIIDHQDFSLTVSIGLASYPIHARDSGKLTELAFKKMFEARERGGDLVLGVEV